MDSNPPSQLRLAIFTSHVGLYPQPPESITSDTLAQSSLIMTPPNTTNANANHLTNLLSGPLTDFLTFSRQDHSQWLIDVAHDICDPSRRRGWLMVWVRDATLDMGTWRAVSPTEPLIASVYLYDIEHVVSLLKISGRAGKSKTTSHGIASTMANRVKDRDGQRCWVSGVWPPLKNGHIFPKRMGDHLLRAVYTTFVQTPPPPALSIYDEMCGITLSTFLDSLFDKYEFGLRLVAPVRNRSLLVFYS